MPRFNGGEQFDERKIQAMLDMIRKYMHDARPKLNEKGAISNTLDQFGIKNGIKRTGYFRELGRRLSASRRQDESDEAACLAEEERIMYRDAAAHQKRQPQDALGAGTEWEEDEEEAVG